MNHNRLFHLFGWGMLSVLLICALPLFRTQAVGAAHTAEPAGRGPHPPDPGPPFAAGRQFVHWASAANTTGYYTCIDHPLTNHQPDAVLLVTHNLNPGGVPGSGTPDDHTLAVAYGATQWCILHQDMAMMPIGTAFNVLIVPPGSQVLIHTTTAANTFGNYTFLDAPITNGRPERLLFVTPNVTPGGVEGTFTDHNLGVWYSGSAERWSIFNQDLAPMALNQSFNVLVINAGDPAAFVHTATAPTIFGNNTALDHPLANDKPSVLLFTTPNWNPRGGGGVYHDHTIGVMWGTWARWRIFNEDLVDMSAGPAFNVLVTGNMVYLPLVVH